MPDFLEKWLRSNALLLISITGAVLFLFIAGVWWAFGKGPRLRRALNGIQTLLAQGDWVEALEKITQLRQRFSLSSSWSKTIDQTEGEILEAGMSAALQGKKFEEALQYSLRSSQLLQKSELEARALVQNAMLDEAHRVFSHNSVDDVPVILELLNRALRVQSPCREASFWMGMCFLRVGQTEEALQFLNLARAGTKGWNEDAGSNAPPPSPIIDPPLYIGTILLRGGQPREALRFLTEANRLDPNCPIVKLQLGAAMIAADRDPQMAVRVLQGSLGPKGLGLWVTTPNRMWVEAFPENRSYIRKLATKYTYTCPIWGSDLSALVHQGTFSLAQGFYRLGQYQEAADSFQRSIQEGAPSLPVLRGLGLSLARLGRYDEAFKHLRTAHDLDNPKDRLTAGYLALCGAKGTVAHAEDRGRNLAWAVRMVTPFSAPGDLEWIGIINEVFGEARRHQVELSLDDQIYLCEHLLTSSAVDPLSAQAYHALQVAHPEAVRPEYAWLFCRSMVEQPLEGQGVLKLFEATFADSASAQTFFKEKGWDFEAVERAFLERAAALQPGRFPAVLGASYAFRGENLLVQHSQAMEQEGHLEKALEDLSTLRRLHPNFGPGLDRLAYLQHRLGRVSESLAVLNDWHQAQPQAPLPLVRRALVLHEQGEVPESQHYLREAMNRCQGKQRASLAFLGARLSLQAIGNAKDLTAASPVLEGAQQFLQAALRDQPDHPQSLWNLAAIFWIQGNHAQILQLAPALKQPQVADPYFQFFAALCLLEAKDYSGVTHACQQIRAVFGEEKPNGKPHVRLDLESDFLAGQARAAMGDLDGAIEALTRPAQASDCLACPQAQMLLGLLRFAQQNHEDATAWWQKIDAGKRAAWKLNEPHSATMFLSALDLFHQGKFEIAADRFRQAGKLGCRDRRLGSLLLLSLFKAGQEAIYGPT